ncbi:hypothetical protein GCM10009565_18890 [Amycolatopsis albidoflavus]
MCWITLARVRGLARVGLAGLRLGLRGLRLTGLRVSWLGQRGLRLARLRLARLRLARLGLSGLRLARELALARLPALPWVGARCGLPRVLPGLPRVRARRGLARILLHRLPELRRLPRLLRIAGLPRLSAGLLRVTGARRRRLPSRRDRARLLRRAWLILWTP